MMFIVIQTSSVGILVWGMLPESIMGTDIVIFLARL